MKDHITPAFPTVREYTHGAGTGKEHVEGMTLRDHFASQVLSGMSAIQDERFCPKDRLPDVGVWRAEQYANDAAYCYAMADAMMEERSKP